ncbi:MAG: hypothetical protein U9N87_05020 [Planctomycetota bacterium]|nr:hypothetical protein [Planctomycetota bacterium]
MSIAVQCPKCGKGYQVRDELSGKQFKCQCGEVVVVGARSALSDLLDEELEIEVDPTKITCPTEWAEATGNTELADDLQNKMSDGLRHNQTFMMGLVGGIAAIMLIIGLGAILFAGP